MFDVVIIGCGIVGAATAYELSKYKLKIAVLEKENDVSTGATKANSAIIHSGYDPKHGTLMAKLNVEGAALAKDLCKTLNIPYKQCGALVLAFSSQELPVLEDLLKNGLENGVEGLRILNRDEVLKLDPNVNGDVVAALYSPTVGIVSPWEYTLALAETAVENGAELRLECEVSNIKKTGEGYSLDTTQGKIHTKYVVNAAGLYSDKINNMVSKETFKIKPSRGEYFVFSKSEGKHVNHVIFQCPSKQGKGILVTPTVYGNLLIGPNSENVTDAGNVSNTAEGLDFIKESSKKSVPTLNFKKTIRNFAGNRAKASNGDFIVCEAKDAKGFINIAGIASPGLSSAPAIAKMAIGFLFKSGIDLHKKDDFILKPRHTRYNTLSETERAKIQDPSYRNIICRCETVTEGEIRIALSAKIPPKSVDAVKRRCGTGMGMCQGKYCGPRVAELLGSQ